MLWLGIFFKPSIRITRDIRATPFPFFGVLSAVMTLPGMGQGLLHGTGCQFSPTRTPSPCPSHMSGQSALSPVLGQVDFLHWSHTWLIAILPNAQLPLCWQLGTLTACLQGLRRQPSCLIPAHPGEQHPFRCSWCPVQLLCLDNPKSWASLRQLVFFSAVSSPCGTEFLNCS